MLNNWEKHWVNIGNSKIPVHFHQCQSCTCLYFTGWFQAVRIVYVVSVGFSICAFILLLVFLGKANPDRIGLSQATMVMIALSSEYTIENITKKNRQDDCQLYISFHGFINTSLSFSYHSSFSLSHNTRFITPERDKQPTCGISFRGHLDPKNDFLQKLDVPFTV